VKSLARVDHFDERTSAWIVAIVSLIGFCAYAFSFYPGVLSFDSAYAWWQVRGGETSDLQAPMMMRLWQLCETAWRGPGLLFLLHLAAFWAGLALIALALRARTLARVGFILVAAFAPVDFVLFGHVWTDVGLAASLTFATGALLRFRDAGGKHWLAAAAIALFYALGVRFNALPAVVPILVCAAWLWQQQRSPGRTLAPSHALLFVVAALGVCGLPAWLIDRHVDRHIPYAPIVELCDLATISVQQDQMFVPQFALAPGTDVAFFRSHAQPWSCLPLFAGTREPTSGWTDSELSELRDAWLNAVAGHPAAYLRHRLGLMFALFGARDPAWPHELVFIDGNVQYRDNPPLAANSTATHALMMRVFHASWYTSLFAAWPYLLLALATLIAAWRRNDRSENAAALAIAASALLYALPYFFVSSSGELRYLGWSCVAAIIGGALLLAPPKAAVILDACPPAP